MTSAGMLDERFELQLLGDECADVYVCGPAWPLVAALDEQAVRAVAAPPGEDVRLILQTCSGVAAAVPGDAIVLREAVALRVPLAVVAEPGARAAVEGGLLHVGEDDPVALADPAAVCVFEDDPGAAAVWLGDRIPTGREPIPPYAFMVGRLERDFAHARDAIRVAVEREAGIPCLWSDDGGHRTNVGSVRERTRLLIRHARFVIADLTLGPESPDQENPSRGHEIGMAIAYGRDVMLCSQEPRRHPYFSIGDMQLTFWAGEGELANAVGGWIRTTPGVYRRRVLNHELLQPRLARPAFAFDPAHGFVGPNLKRRALAPLVTVGLGVAVVILLVVFLS